MKKSQYLSPVSEVLKFESANGVIAASALAGGTADSMYIEDTTIDWETIL